MAKEQDLRIKVYDHRREDTRTFRYSDRTEYLSKLEDLASEPRVDMVEKTQTAVHLYPERQNKLDL